MFRRQFEDFIAFLFRNETEGQLRHGMTRNDGFCSFPLIAAADSVDLGRWTRPDTLHRIVTGFAEKFRRACFLKDQLVPIDWKLTPRFAFPILERLHAIVKAGD